MHLAIIQFVRGYPEENIEPPFDESKSHTRIMRIISESIAHTSSVETGSNKRDPSTR